MSIHADDEFSLRTALESELDDVAPATGLADVVIARYRRGRRRRVAGAVGLVVVFAGVGVPLAVAAGAPARPGHAVLRLAPYTLELPAQYRLTVPRAAPCGAAAAAWGHAAPARPAAEPAGWAEPAGAAGVAGPARVVAAAGSSGGCVLMLLTAPFTPRAPGSGDPNVPPGARKVAVGRYRAWLVPPAYGGPGDGAALVIPGSAPHGRIRDLVIGSSGLSQTALVSLVSANLS